MATTAKRTVAVPRKTAVAKASASTSRTAVSRKTGKEVAVEMHAYIPHSRVAQNYVGRQIWGTWDADLFDIAMEDNSNILLEGDTGSGKTLAGEAYASLRQLPYYSLPCDVSIDPSSLFGRRQPGKKQGTFPWMDGPATWIFRHGGILNVSEVNFMTPKIAASLFPAFDGRRYIPLLGNDGEIVRAHRGGGKLGGRCWCSLSKKECDSKRVLIIADDNPNYRGTMELNAAFKNRFRYKIPWGYDSTVEAQLVKFPTVREVARKLREMAGIEIFTPISTNMLMEFEETAMRPGLSLDFAINNFVSAFKSDEQKSVNDQMQLNKTNVLGDIDYFLKEERRRARAADSDVDDDDAEEIEYELEVED